MNITHMSVSRKSVWDECKKKYHFKYHLKIEPTEPEPFYFTYGKIIHKIAEEYVRMQGKSAIGEVTNLVLNGEIPLEENVFAPKLPVEYKTKMPDHIKSISKITNEIGFDGELEWDFKYDLDQPKEKYVIGFIDRLIKKKDKFFILDYKTTKKGKFRKNKQTIKDDLQLRTYARIVQKQFNVPAKDIITALYYLEGGDLISASFSEESLESAEKILLEAYDSIKESDPNNVWGTVGNHCYRCEYSKICPFFNKTK
jgi:CRISPR/Cas system-associated exonuclease Cas4 (RecB family)